MAVTIKQTEGIANRYPPAPEPLSAAALALDVATLWDRVESYIAWRAGERDVEWVVEGPGDWCAPLRPATIATTEVWSLNDGWTIVALRPSPLGGYVLPGEGPYRFLGTVGDNDADVPALVQEAFRRLAEYIAAEETDGRVPGARQQSESTDGIDSIAFERSPAWLAMALVNSGAADLLRGFRRA